MSLDLHSMSEGRAVIDWQYLCGHGSRESEQMYFLLPFRVFLHIKEERACQLIFLNGRITPKAIKTLSHEKNLRR